MKSTPELNDFQRMTVELVRSINASMVELSPLLLLFPKLFNCGVNMMSFEPGGDQSNKLSRAAPRALHLSGLYFSTQILNTQKLTQKQCFWQHQSSLLAVTILG